MSSNAQALLCAATAFALLLCGSTSEGREPWQVLKDCRLVPNESNDGDSFHVQAGGKEYLFRLYFVDAPETEMSFPERVNEQASYFGITPNQAITTGNLAKKFAQEKLTGPFTVRTCMQGAMGRSNMERFYAFVGTADGDLAELLVANGLARVHGSAAAPEGLNSPGLEWQKLQRLEREAKAQKVGSWGATSGRMLVRLPRQPAKSGPESFDAFFHPKRIAKTGDSDVDIPSPAPAKPSEFVAAAAKLDVNTATSAELLAIPGVGPVIAQRIREARPFKSADDLRTVKGIGPKKFEKLRPLFL